MKKTEKIKVKGCIYCPFRNYSYDDFAIGDPETHECNILKEKWHKNLIENRLNTLVDYFIDFNSSGKIKSKNKKTLDNCPLLSNDFVISFSNDEKSKKPSPPPPPENRILKEGKIPKPPKK